MSTWNALIDAALSEIGAADLSGGTATDRTFCLGHLNRMLSGWSAEIGPIQAETVDSVTWASGNASRTIGSGGNFAVARPERLIKAQYRDSSNADSPITLITHQQYQGLEDKTHSSATPLFLAYNPTAATGTLFIWPVPSADVTIRLTSYKPFTAITDQTAESGLSSGYEAAVVPNLAKLIAPAFGAVLTELTHSEALRSKAVLLRANLVQQPMQPEYGGECGDDVNLWTNP